VSSLRRRRRLRPHPRRRTDLGAGGRTIALLLVLGAELLGCRGTQLPILGTVPGFVLTERSGSVVRAADLEGSVWIAGFIFTRCPDICPALTARMADLQKTLGESDGVRLVSFSVDPVHDTPDVLRGYADRAGAKGDWLFLTGPRDQLATLLKDGFHVAFADDGPAEAPITHSDRLVLVDRALRIRGYYHGRNTEDLARLSRDAETLRDG
jgi:cytochrome oxidase Cu insertion factor (SCO1/SenC/PrrC family)